MKERALVREKKSGKLGVVICDEFGLCEDGEVLVVYEGATYGLATSLEELEVVGPENAAADLKKCGHGEGALCCIYLAFVDGEFVCQRFGKLRTSIMFMAGKMRAKREPVEFYPKCQFD